MNDVFHYSGFVVLALIITITRGKLLTSKQLCRYLGIGATTFAVIVSTGCASVAETGRSTSSQPSRGIAEGMPRGGGATSNVLADKFECMIEAGPDAGSEVIGAGINKISAAASGRRNFSYSNPGGAYDRSYDRCAWQKEHLRQQAIQNAQRKEQEDERQKRWDTQQAKLHQQRIEDEDRRNAAKCRDYTNTTINNGQVTQTATKDCNRQRPAGEKDFASLDALIKERAGK